MTDAEPVERQESFKEAVEARIPGGGTLDSDVWSLEVNERTTRDSVVFKHRDSISRIEFYNDAGFIDTEIRLEPYKPLPDDSPVKQDPHDVDDVLVTSPKEFELLGEAVWLAEYYARQLAEEWGDQ